MISTFIWLKVLILSLILKHNYASQIITITNKEKRHKMGSYKIFNFKKAYRWGNKELMRKKQNKWDDRFKHNDMKDVEFLFHQFFFLLSTTLKICSIAFSLLYCILYCILVLIVFSKKFVILIFNYLYTTYLSFSGYLKNILFITVFKKFVYMYLSVVFFIFLMLGVHSSS